MLVASAGAAVADGDGDFAAGEEADGLRFVGKSGGRIFVSLAGAEIAEAID